MAYLVTGVGYVGSRLIADILQRGHAVVAVDNLFSTDRRAVELLAREPRFRFVEGDVADARTLERAFALGPVETVFSLAAQSSGHPQAAEPRYTETTNLLAPRLLLDAMVRHGVATVVYASSFKLYGDALPPVVTEQTPFGHLYDLSHLSSYYVEKLLELYALTRGLRCAAVRLGIVHGLSPVMKTDYRFMTAPNKFCLQIARGEPLQVYAAGCRPSGFVHVADAAESLWLAAEPPEGAGFTALNAVTEVTTTFAIAHQAADMARRRGFPAEVISEGAPSDQPLPMVRSALPLPRHVPQAGDPRCSEAAELSSRDDCASHDDLHRTSRRRDLEASLSEVLDHFQRVEAARRRPTGHQPGDARAGAGQELPPSVPTTSAVGGATPADKRMTDG